MGQVDLNALAHEIGIINFNFYETGWISCSSWGNRHLGSTASPKNTDSYVAHNLNADLSELIVKLMVSTAGTDNNCFQIDFSGFYRDAAAQTWGCTVSQIDKNNLKIQTALQGMQYFNDAGGWVPFSGDDWYYNIKVFRLSKV
jgi:hypothetical protein